MEVTMDDVRVDTRPGPMVTGLAANQASPGGRPHAALPTPPPPPSRDSDTRKLPQIGIPALKLAHDTTLIVTIQS